MNDQIPVEELAPAEVGEIDLYRKRERIYTRKVEGFYQRIRLFTGWPLLAGYFCLPWLNWGSRQAVLFDLPERKFHIFAVTFWPQDFPLLAWLLIISAMSLFAVTVFAGRVWCGYTCPQTVWTSIFMWAEQRTEGTRNQRIKRDQGSWTGDKILRKSLKHLMWLGWAFFTGVTFVGYFTPIRELLPDLLTLSTNKWAAAWTVFFTLATYINAGWLREQVCKYMCPYARFQSVMFDPNTLIVSYDKSRGEPRGSRRKDADRTELGLGDCIDCELCVQVCPTGIDIRDGLQYECITCALCIDACNSVMSKMNYPRGLIRYTTENSLQGEKSRVLRPRLLGYIAVILAMITLFTLVLLSRIPVGVDVTRERGALYHETADGLIENVYALKIRNMSQSPEQYRLSIKGLESAKLIGETIVDVASGEVYPLTIRVQHRASGLTRANTRIVFVVESKHDPSLRAEQESRFLAPSSAVAR